ncbi:MAG: hypothetical protein WB985_00490 [Candidatus Acidiferrales bacterium]
MTEFEDPRAPGAEKRRSTRIIKSVPITVVGTDVLGQPFHETTHTVMINCYGCKYQSVHYVPKNTSVSIEVHRMHRKLPSRSVRGRVIWVQRPRSYQDVYHIGLEFEVAGNVWSLAAPPVDWFPFPGDETELNEPELSKLSSTSAAKGTNRSDQVLLVPSSVAVTEDFEVDVTAEIAAVAKPAPHRTPNGERHRERQNLSMREMVREIVDEKITEHSVTMRRHIDDALQRLLEKVYERMQATAEESRQEIRAVREALTVVPPPDPKGRPNRRRRGNFTNISGQS